MAAGAPGADGAERTDVVTVVLIEPQTIVRECLASALDRDPRIRLVGSGASGEDAIRLATEVRADAVVLSCTRWNDGLRLTCRKLRERAPTTRLVALSGQDNNRSLIDSLKAGCSGYLTTAVSVDELVRAVLTVHQGGLYAPAASLGALLPGSTAGVGADLTDREREVLEGLADGLTNAALAARLFLSVHTVRGHVQSILMKLEAHTRLEAVAVATRAGLVAPR